MFHNSRLYISCTSSEYNYSATLCRSTSVHLRRETPSSHYQDFAGSLALLSFPFYKSSNQKDMLVNPMAAGSGHSVTYSRRGTILEGEWYKVSEVKYRNVHIIYKN